MVDDAGAAPGMPDRRAGLGAVVIVVLTLVAYFPALRAGFIWDDDAYVTENELLVAPGGLVRIWTGVEVPQYYPLTFTTFWIERRLWGLEPLGYHLVNVALHATNAVLVACVLSNLCVPGAWWIGAVFALHPVHVESVAWVTERKNVLSAFFYLLAFACYLRFTELRAWRWYGAALGLFLAALTSKTIAATFPAAVLMALWYRRRRLPLGDVPALVPFFVVGAGFGALTAWLEQAHVGAIGPDFSLGFGSRVLLAARAMLFYPTKLLAPADLTFIYPRWVIDSGDPAAYVPLAVVAAVILVLLLLHRRVGPGPLAAFGFYGLSIFPSLGFLNVYPFLFSYVADHFQYLASLGPLILAAGAGAALGRRVWTNPPARARAGVVVAAGTLAVLGTLTWSRAKVFHDEEKLWRDTLVKNPEAWLAHNNLGVILVERGDREGALFHYGRAIEIYPHYGAAHANLANALVAEGRLEEAVPRYAEALRLDPTDAAARHMLALVLAEQGEVEAAVPHFREAAAAAPDDPAPRTHLAEALDRLGDREAAIEEYQRALALDPNDVTSRYNLAVGLAAVGRTAEAVTQYQGVILRDSDNADAHNNLAVALRKTGDLAAALPHARRAVEAAPGDDVVRVNLATLLEELGREAEAIAVLREGLLQRPRSVSLANTLAWYLATAPRPSLRDGAQAVRLAEQVCGQMQYRDPNLLDTLAAAYAEAGRFSDAMRTARRALDLATSPEEAEIAAALRERLSLYEARQPYHRPPREE